MAEQEGEEQMNMPRGGEEILAITLAVVFGIGHGKSRQDMFEIIIFGLLGYAVMKFVFG